MPPRTMEVYLQEIASTVYFPQLPSALKARVLQLASACPGLLVRLERFVLTKVPPQFWHDFFCRMDTDGNTGKNLAEVNARQQYAMQRDPTQHEAKVKEESEQKYIYIYI